MSLKHNGASAEVGSHRWCVLTKGDGSTCHFRKGLKEGIKDASSYMFEQIGRDRHLLLHNGINLGIIDGTEKLVMANRLFKIRQAEREVNGVVTAHGTLLREYTMVGIEAEAFKMDVAVAEMHRRNLPSGRKDGGGK